MITWSKDCPFCLIFVLYTVYVFYTELANSNKWKLNESSHLCSQQIVHLAAWVNVTNDLVVQINPYLYSMGLIYDDNE